MYILSYYMHLHCFMNLPRNSFKIGGLLILTATVENMLFQSSSHPIMASCITRYTDNIFYNCRCYMLQQQPHRLQCVTMCHNNVTWCNGSVTFPTVGYSYRANHAFIIFISLGFAFLFGSFVIALGCSPDIVGLPRRRLTLNLIGVNGVSKLTEEG